MAVSNVFFASQPRNPYSDEERGNASAGGGTVRRVLSPRINKSKVTRSSSHLCSSGSDSGSDSGSESAGGGGAAAGGALKRKAECIDLT